LSELKLFFGTLYAELSRSGSFLPYFKMFLMLEMKMSIAVTQAAVTMEDRADELTPHQVIQLLLAGALERLDQAALQLRCGREGEAGKLMGKAIGIINGLRESLDFEMGGDMAVKLEKLYSYLIQRLSEAEADTGEFVLAESCKMLGELKAGWDDLEV